MKPIASKNFGLHESEFHVMCEQLKLGNEEMFERIYLKHFKICKQYLKVQLKANDDESHDAAMQTLLNFRRSLILGKIKYGNLSFLFTQMAYYEVIKKRNRANTELDRNLEYLRSATVEIPDSDSAEHVELVKILETLPEDQKKLIINHYYNSMKLKDIAELEGVTDSTIRKRKERIIKSIKSRLASKLKM